MICESKIKPRQFYKVKESFIKQRSYIYDSKELSYEENANIADVGPFHEM
jgi:hypothetical protein